MEGRHFIAFATLLQCKCACTCTDSYRFIYLPLLLSINIINKVTIIRVRVSKLNTTETKVKLWSEWEVLIHGGSDVDATTLYYLALSFD